MCLRSGHITPISVDVTHGFFLPTVDVDSGLIEPGEMQTIGVIPEKPGTYKSYRKVLCTTRLRDMTGQLTIDW